MIDASQVRLRAICMQMKGCKDMHLKIQREADNLSLFVKDKAAKSREIRCV